MVFDFAYTESHIDWLIIDLYCNIKWAIFQLHLLKEHKNSPPHANCGHSFKSVFHHGEETRLYKYYTIIKGW